MREKSCVPNIFPFTHAIALVDEEIFWLPLYHMTSYYVQKYVPGAHTLSFFIPVFDYGEPIVRTTSLL